MIQRMRVFAGPNGSGKTSLVDQFIEEKDRLIDPAFHINPDELNSIDVLDFDKFGLTVDEDEFRDFIFQSPFYRNCGIDVQDIKIEDNRFNIVNSNSYMGAMLADYLRHSLIRTKERLFSFETVFSHPSKIDFLKMAEEHGWAVYLYFVSTQDPEINCERVAERVLRGKHDVPQDKIRERYTKAHDNLYPALKHCRRAYIFDNSIKMQLIAEKKPDGSLVLSKECPVPAWFNDCVLSRIE
ncbi:hypothetical protein HWN40_04015 [Methanolobus zinderi]|uniref:UDP-N-acetylglucosamine kinase n=2 Tax=Methanolobus zinderi TaxID=536044 RepID=A0A7D5I4B6_9EURY|nr:MAG: hypothetical protein AWU59_695 [Methanolobus sp. T82-4]QLC49483.1 hypothetical protein HWN40_04015 [Methanolobus zinderi]